MINKTIEKIHRLVHSEPDFGKANYELELGIEVFNTLRKECLVHDAPAGCCYSLLGIPIKLDFVDPLKIKLWKEVGGYETDIEPETAPADNEIRFRYDV